MLSPPISILYNILSRQVNDLHIYIFKLSEDITEINRSCVITKKLLYRYYF